MITALSQRAPVVAVAGFCSEEDLAVIRKADRRSSAIFVTDVRDSCA